MYMYVASVGFPITCVPDLQVPLGIIQALWAAVVELNPSTREDETGRGETEQQRNTREPDTAVPTSKTNPRHNVIKPVANCRATWQNHDASELCKGSVRISELLLRKQPQSRFQVLAVLDENVAPILVEVLTIYKDSNPELLLDTLCLLSKIASGTTEPIQFIKNLGVLPALCNLVNHENYAVQKQAMRCLVRLCVYNTCTQGDVAAKLPECLDRSFVNEMFTCLLQFFRNAADLEAEVIKNASRLVWNTLRKMPTSNCSAHSRCLKLEILVTLDEWGLPYEIIWEIMFPDSGNFIGIAVGTENYNEIMRNSIWLVLQAVTNTPDQSLECFTTRTTPLRRRRRSPFPAAPGRYTISFKEPS